MHKKHTDQQVYSSCEVPQSYNAKRTEKIREKKEHGNTKQEEPRSNSHKATQKNKTNRLNVEVQLIGLTMQLLLCYHWLTGTFISV